MQKYKFDIYFPGEPAAGLRAFTERVEVTVECDAGGEPGDFEEHILQSLAEWFDGASVTPEHVIPNEHEFGAGLDLPG